MGLPKAKNARGSKGRLISAGGSSTVWFLRGEILRFVSLPDNSLPGRGSSPREFGNFALLDLLIFTQPDWHYFILEEIHRKICNMYAKFVERNPNWDGEVFFWAHSLGTVLIMDLLLKSSKVVKDLTSRFAASYSPGAGSRASQTNPLGGGMSWGGGGDVRRDLGKGSLEIPPGPSSSPGGRFSSNNNISNTNLEGQQQQQPDSPGELPLPGNELSGRLTNRSISPRRNQTVLLPPAEMSLPFEPLAFFAFGSPIGLFRVISEASVDGVEHPTALPGQNCCVRDLLRAGADKNKVAAGAGAGNDTTNNISEANQNNAFFRVLTESNWRFYNVFHPDDCVAYRVEPLLSKKYEKIDPEWVPHEGGTRLHTNFKKTTAEVVDGIVGIWEALGGSQGVEGAKRESQIQQDGAAEFNSGQRIDWQLQSSVAEARILHFFISVALN